MPIFMDRHDVSDEVTAEIVADLHQKDLKIQHKFGCNGLTYWFDAERKTAFCLVEAPHKSAIQEMHNFAHGEVAHRIIEVDGAIVESFLGRIEDPEKSQKTALNIINDPAFRTIMVVKFILPALPDAFEVKINLVLDHPSKYIVNIANEYNGRIVIQKQDYFLVSFDSVTNAVLGALEIQAGFKKYLDSQNNPPVQMHIGLSAGVPVSDKEGLFEETIKMAEYLCEVVKGQLVVSTEVKDLFESENQNIPLDKKHINVLHSNDEKFLNQLMDYTEKEWSNAGLNVDDFGRFLGYSKSQLYRKMISITGHSPNRFVREYRLNKALQLLNKQCDNISEVAYETGFNTPAYFSKCFQDAFGILPSQYLKSCRS